jgi:hypothetical protein
MKPGFCFFKTIDFGFTIPSQNFIYKHTVDSKNVQKELKIKKRENLQYVKLLQTRFQNLSMSTTDHP